MTRNRLKLGAAHSGNKVLKPIKHQVDILPHSPRRKIDLHDGHAIRRELAALYRDARAGIVETSTATRLAYILDLLRRAYETSELQVRLESLEHALNHRRN